MKGCALSLSALLLFAVPAVAQEGNQPAPPASRPYRGLFGSGMAGMTQSLSVNASLGGGYDDNAVRDLTAGLREGGTDWNSSYQSAVSYASAALSYSLNLERVSIGASAATMGRYYPQLSDSVFRRDTVSVGGSVAILRSLSINGFAAYQPYSLSSLFPVLEAAEGADSGVLLPMPFESSFEHFRSYGGGADFSTALGRRTTLTTSYSYRQSDAPSTRRGFDGHSVRGGFQHRLTQHLSIGIDYRYREATYASSADKLRHHDVDGGVNYNRDFSLLRSRRTTLSFSTGTSLTTRARRNERISETPEDSTVRTDERLHARLNGDATLRHEFGRSWSGSVMYRRGVTISHELLEPVYSDAVSAGLVGLITNRLQFSATARGTTGRIGASDDDSTFDSYSASMGLAFFVSRNVSSGLNYTYHRHNFRDAGLLAPGFAPNLGRNSIRAYITAWAPIFSSGRRP